MNHLTHKPLSSKPVWLGPGLGLITFALTITLLLNQSETTPTSENKSLAIPQITQQALITRIAQGEQVVFVDAREDQEYQEEHIPGAKNLVLREVSVDTVKSLQGKAVVVAYCLKDFRGFELAKALARHGVDNVYVMGKSGINGWKTLGLPTTGGKAKLSEQQAEAKLLQCAREKNCIKEQAA